MHDLLAACRLLMALDALQKAQEPSSGAPEGESTGVGPEAPQGKAKVHWTGDDRMESAGAWGCGWRKGKAQGSAKREDVTCNKCRNSFTYQRGDLGNPLDAPPDGQNRYREFPYVEPDIFKRRGWKRPAGT